MRLVIASMIALSLFVPSSAYAHVKWFCSTVDVTSPLLPLAAVLTPLFWVSAFGFTLLVFAGFHFDGWVARRWPILGSSGPLNAGVEGKLVRLATGAYFLLLWDKGAEVAWRPGDSLLTPELLTDAAGWTSPLHFAIAALTIWRRTYVLAAVGIGILYVYGISWFGIFHMTDYVFFPGIAAYLALTSIGSTRALRLRVPILSGGLAFGLMWTAIEKFVYPQWTLAVVVDHPNLAFGFDPALVVVMAGLVEFTLAFYIMVGRGLVRLGAAAFATIFAAAIPEFGHLDAVGHIPIIAILGVVLLHGASPLQKRLGILERGQLANASAVSLIYVTSLAGF